MSAQVAVVLGPARAGKTHELLSRYFLSLTTGSTTALDRRLWIAPNPRAATLVRDALLDRGGAACLAPGITTFDGLSKEIVFAADLKIRQITRVQQRELLRRTVAMALAEEKLQFFAEAARRSGFIDLFAEHIQELRQRDISPSAYQQIATTRGQPIQHRELALLYTHYDRQLAAHHLCDGEGIYWAARAVLAKGDCRRFAKLDLVVLDGFTDFTRTQHEILCLLADRSERLFISLPTGAVEDGARTDLFAKTTATLVELKDAFPQLKERKLSSRRSFKPTLDHITRNIFRHPQAAPPADAIEGLSCVEIIEATGVHDEAIQLARRIKGLLVAPPDRNNEATGLLACPTKPDDIVVVFRSLADAAPRIEEVFNHFGIPFSVESSARVASAPIFRTFTSLLQLDADDWPFRRVVSVITNNLLSAVADSARLAADWLVRDLQIASGRDQLLETVADLAAQQDESQDFSDHYQRRIAAATAALPAFTQIAQAFDKLPREASPCEWTIALVQLASKLGFAPFVENSTVSAAWQTLVGHFAALERLDRWLGESPRKLDRRELLSLLIDVATHEGLPRAHDDVGRVRVLSAPSARTVTARHLFLAGMSEQAFPAAAPAGRLANEGDYRFLAKAAHQTDPLPLGEGRVRAPSSLSADASPTATRAQDEMLLFYEVIGRAQESLTISYPAMDEKAQELPPSPYVVELQRMFRNCDRTIRCIKPQLSPIPRPDSIGSFADWRTAAVAEASQTEGDRRLLAGIFSHKATKAAGQAIDAGVRIVHARARGESFGPSEGMLDSPAVAARLSQRFGAKHSWSPSQFETYAACPYKFFLEDLLGLEPLGDLALETDFARRGSLLHRVLAAFHRNCGDSSSDWSALCRDESRFAAELKHALQAAVDATPREGIEAALLELDRRQIDKWTDLYRGQHEKYYGTWIKLDEPPRPAHFELRFGRKHPGDVDHEDSSSIDDAFKLDISGELINIVGRIDRIDVGRVGAQTVFNVIDYKSGKRPTLTSEKIESGERLQPALYVMAAQALVFGDQANPLWAGYWSMQGGVTTNKQYSLHCSVENGAPTESWNELKPKVIARIGEIVRDVRRGEFPVASRDLNCTNYCDFKTVCRIAQVRSVGKIVPSGEPKPR